jgi:hypothetical protein
MEKKDDQRERSKTVSSFAFIKRDCLNVVDISKSEKGESIESDRTAFEKA